MTTQEAFDHAGSMLDDCYRKWDNAKVELPSFGEVIDGEIKEYMDAMLATMTANLHWQ